MSDHIGYKFWHMYWADEKVHFEVKQELENNFFLCEPVPEDLDEFEDHVDPVVLSRKDIERYMAFDSIFS